MGKLPSVKRWYYIVLGVILIGGIVYIYMHRQQLGLVGNSVATEGPQPAHINWATVDRSSEGFKLEMPADAREVQVPAYDQKGSTDEVNMLYAYPDATTSYSVSWADNPPVARAAGENADATLDDARDGALARTETSLVSESKSIRQGYPVRDFVGKNDQGGIFNARLILAGQRLYLLMVAYPAQSARSDSDMNRFFDSFRILTPPNNQ